MVIVQQLLKNVEIIGWCLVWLRNRKGAVSSLCVNVGGQSHMSLGEKICEVDDIALKKCVRIEKYR